MGGRLEGWPRLKKPQDLMAWDVKIQWEETYREELVLSNLTFKISYNIESMVYCREMIEWLQSKDEGER